MGAPDEVHVVGGAMRIARSPLAALRPDDPSSARTRVYAPPSLDGTGSKWTSRRTGQGVAKLSLAPVVPNGTFLRRPTGAVRAPSKPCVGRESLDEPDVLEALTSVQSAQSARSRRTESSSAVLRRSAPAPRFASPGCGPLQGSSYRSGEPRGRAFLRETMENAMTTRLVLEQGNRALAASVQPR